jgi:hypothetical protein
MPRQRSTTDAVSPTTDSRQRGRPDLPVALTRAEARALRRSAPLTPEQFKSLRRLAEQGVNPLRHR